LVRVVVSTVGSHWVTRSLIVVLSSTSSEILSGVNWDIHVNVDVCIIWSDVDINISLDWRKGVSSSVMQVHWVWLVVWIIIPSWSGSCCLRVWVLAWVVITTISLNWVTRCLIVILSSASQKILSLNWYIYIDVNISINRRNRISTSVMKIHGIWGLVWIVISTVGSHWIARSLIVISSMSQSNLSGVNWYIYVNVDIRINGGN